MGLGEEGGACLAIGTRRRVHTVICRERTEDVKKLKAEKAL